MKTCIRIFIILLSVLLLAAVPLPSQPVQPETPVKLVFIHHSTGENWLTDGYGDLGITLWQNNYFVSDTNYGWGPDGIGDRTDIPNWIEWFASEHTDTYTQALFNENGQHSSYTRTLPDPGGENQIILFKSCFPNSELAGKPDDPPGEYEEMTVSGAKYVYNTILPYFASHPDKLFIVITAPPVSANRYAKNARAFNQWLVQDWLRENNYPLNNVAVFDFYNILTGPDAHHRITGGQVEHLVGAKNTLHYPSDDDHPSVEGSRKATAEFVPWLNYHYQRWQQSAPQAAIPAPASTAAAETQPQPQTQDMPSSAPMGTIDDFEGAAPAGSAGWEGYFQEDGRSSISCGTDSQISHAGAASLQFSFDLPPESWATCGFYFDSAQDWSAAQGLSFFLRADHAAIPLDIDVYSGSPAERTTFLLHTQTPAGSDSGWVQMNIPWSDIRRAEWEENAGAPLDPARITGFSLGLATSQGQQINGTLWMDDLTLASAPVSAPAEPPLQVVPSGQPAEEEDQPVGGLRNLPCIGSLLLPFLIFGLARLLKRY